MNIYSIADQLFVSNLLGTDALSAAYVGYIWGISPVISFHYGAQSYGELNKLYRIALKTIAVMSGITFLISFPLARPIARLFADGAWISMPMAEVLSIVLTVFYFKKMKKRYPYA